MAHKEELTEYSFLAITAPDLFSELQNFSLVVGSPVFHIFRRWQLVGGDLEFLYRRLLVIASITWLPLLLLASLGSWFGSTGRVSFLHDIEVHVRMLVVLPVLVSAELIVHSRIRPIVRYLVNSHIVSVEDLPRYQLALESAVRIQRSVAIEVGLFAFAYAFALWRWHTLAALKIGTWYSITASVWQLTPAGWWYVLVSLPVLNFFLLLWYLRLVIWFRFLWHVSKINLKLTATHPDRCAGLSFLGRGMYAFGPVLFAQGVMLAAVVATRVLYGGEGLVSFKFQIAGFVGFFLVITFAPLLMFTPAMADAKRKALTDYGLLAQRYVDYFDDKWLARSAEPEELLGAADIQSLADLANSYSNVREMRVVPFGLNDVSRLAIVTAAPLLPLLLTTFSLEDLVAYILKTVF